MKKVLIVDPDKCSGCRICELVCSLRGGNEANPRKAHIRVIRNQEMDIHMVTLGVKCDFCNECVEWWLPGAIEFVEKNEAILKWKGTRPGKVPAPLFGKD